MTFVFLLILIVVLTVIALVATGRISRTTPAEHDQQPTYVPTAPVGVEALRRTRFGIAFRGYRMDEVDRLIEQILLTMDQQATNGQGEVPVETGGNDNVRQGHTE